MVKFSEEINVRKFSRERRRVDQNLIKLNQGKREFWFQFCNYFGRFSVILFPFSFDL